MKQKYPIQLIYYHNVISWYRGILITHERNLAMLWTYTQYRKPHPICLRLALLTEPKSVMPSYHDREWLAKTKSVSFKKQ